MSEVAFIYGVWGGFLGCGVVLGQHLALGFFAIPIASFLGGMLVKASPKTSAILMGASTVAWVFLINRHRIDLTAAATMVLSGCGALLSVNNLTMRYPTADVSNEEITERD
jgi:hypothetical protein